MLKPVSGLLVRWAMLSCSIRLSDEVLPCCPSPKKAKTQERPGPSPLINLTVTGELFSVDKEPSRRYSGIRRLPWWFSVHSSTRHAASQLLLCRRELRQQPTICRSLGYRLNKGSCGTSFTVSPPLGAGIVRDPSDRPGDCRANEPRTGK